MGTIHFPFPLFLSGCSVTLGLYFWTEPMIYEDFFWSSISRYKILTTDSLQFSSRSDVIYQSEMWRWELTHLVSSRQLELDLCPLCQTLSQQEPFFFLFFHGKSTWTLITTTAQSLARELVSELFIEYLKIYKHVEPQRAPGLADGKYLSRTSLHQIWLLGRESGLCSRHILFPYDPQT